MISSNFAVFCETEKEFHDFVKSSNITDCVRITDTKSLVGYNLLGFIALKGYGIKLDVFTALSRRLQSRLCVQSTTPP